MHGTSDHCIWKLVPGHIRSIASWSLPTTFGPLVKSANGCDEWPRLSYRVGRKAVLQAACMKCGSLVTFTLALLSLNTIGCTASFLGMGWFTFLAAFEGGAQLLMGEWGCLTLALVGAKDTWSSTLALLLTSPMYCSTASQQSDVYQGHC